MKTKYPRADALAVARELSLLLCDECVRLQYAGSLRRRKTEVGDIELVFIPDFAEVREDFFAPPRRVSLVDKKLDELLAAGVIAMRKNAKGSTMWGDKNKFAVHVASGIPVDLFATTEKAWFNYLVCRTGGAISNTQIATAAQKQGWRWTPYGPGFVDRDGEVVAVRSEREVFALVGLRYLDPEDRP